DSFREILERSHPMALVLHRLAKHDLDLLADETLEFAGVGEFPLDAGRADLERVPRARHDVLDVQDRSDVKRNEFAIGVRDTLRLVNEDAQDSAAAAPEQLDLDNFDAFARSNSFGDLSHFFRYNLSIPV